MPKRLKETGKSVLIVLLFCSAIVLAGQTELFRNFTDVFPFLSGIGRLIGPERDGPATDSKPVISAAAAPLYAVVTRNGDHCGIKYDSTALNAFYTRFGGILGDALSSSMTPTEIGEDEWKFALTSVGVYLDFGNKLPLSTLLKSRDSKLTSDPSAASVRRICIAALQNQSRVYIYYINETNGSYYRTLTSVNQNLLASYTSEYLPNDAKFAFELGDAYSITEPYTLLLKTTKAMTVSSSNPVGVLISRDKVMEQFGVNSLLGSQINESANSSLFIAEHFILRVNADGTVVYRVSGNNSGSILKIKSSGSVPTDYEMLESARILVSATLGSSCGAGTSLLLSEFGYSADEKVFNIYFDYYVNGIPVKLLSSRHAASITVSGGYIVTANLIFRNYWQSGTVENVLPERQAAVLVSNTAEPLLIYLDDGGEKLKPLWSEK